MLELLLIRIGKVVPACTAAMVEVHVTFQLLAVVIVGSRQSQIYLFPLIKSSSFIEVM